MSRIAFLLICIQACLVQDALSVCAGPAGFGALSPYTTGVGPYGLADPMATGYAGPYATGFADPFGYGYGDYGVAPPCAGYSAYGGAGAGNVAVAGELPVGGVTVLAGQVPIIGGVQFGGVVPAAGAVTIAGSCACGCGGPYTY